MPRLGGSPVPVRLAPAGRMARALAVAIVMVMSIPGANASTPAGEAKVHPTASAAPALRPPMLADFKDEATSPEAIRVANWAIHSGDNRGMPYMVIDKVNAKVFVFDNQGRLQGAAPALLGMERGDGTSEGLGDKKLSSIRPTERTTPAGRFVASLARDLKGQEILWIDYDSALALHRVAKGTPAEQRAQRLQSESSDDNRISFGCINVPVPFYEGVVSQAFARSNGVVYILPETRSADEEFGSYEAPMGSPTDAARQ